MELTWTEKPAVAFPRSVLVLAGLFLLLFFAFPLLTSLAEGPTAPAPDPITQNEQSMLARINEVRASYGLYPFREATLLDNAAGAHVTEAQARNYMSHRGANGSSYYNRVASAGYEADKVNEAIGWGYALERQLTWWLNSPVHRAILLSSTYTDIGVGYAGNPAKSWGHWWVVNVATQR